MWSFIYGSGNPLVYSVAELREALIDQVRQLDPNETNAALRQMVVIGHSQGGLLTKGTVVDTGDRLWSMINTNRLEDLEISEELRAEIRRLLFYEPLPFVERVVFIATPAPRQLSVSRSGAAAGAVVRVAAGRDRLPRNGPVEHDQGIRSGSVLGWQDADESGWHVTEEPRAAGHGRDPG